MSSSMDIRPGDAVNCTAPRSYSCATADRSLYFSSRPLSILSRTAVINSPREEKPRGSIGAWKTAVTVIGLMANSLFGQHSKVPTMVTGAMGTPASIARWNGPFLNGSMRPSRVRVPSG